MIKLSYIIPCYFNGENLPITTKVLIENEKLFIENPAENITGNPAENIEFEYIMVDDGSQDNTWEELEKFHALFPQKVKIIKLTSNVGSFNAILAGMNYATGDCNVILAADLQDPPELIPQMLEYWKKGIKLVIANRSDREESFGQKLFSNTYHYLVKKLALKNVPEGGFDLVLFDKELREKIVAINEKNTNILYLLTWLGYSYVNIPYVRRKREIGKSRWTLTKKIKMFIDSFVAFSFFPIRAISVMGIVLSLCAVLYAGFIIFGKVTGLIQTEGWSSMMLVLLIVSSFQMLGMGVLGEYIWRTLDTVRKRPPFVVETVKDEKSS